MRRVDDAPLDPEIIAVLDAIDATLRGDVVDPEHAEYAEVALMLAADRPLPSAEFARSLDARVARRFAPDQPARKRPRRWSLLPAMGVGLAAVLAVVVVAASGGGGSAGLRASSSSGTGGAKAVASPITTPEAGRAASGPAPVPYPGLRLSPNGRKVVQSSQLALSSPSNRIDDVAQEVFDLVGAQNGFVNSSSVTAAGGPNGYAQFQLSVPSAALAQTMTQLSELRYAQVVSRTDDTTDVTNKYSSVSSELAQAQALRTSLLKQLQDATTQNQISSLQAQLADADAKIRSAQRTLRSLNQRVSYSTISVTVQGTAPLAPARGGGGFTIGKAAHDAGTVLTAVAGVALIALSVLVPVGLLGALGWWIGAALRRRRREQALDLA